MGRMWVAVGLVVALLVGCGEDEDRSVQYIVGIGSQPGIVVTVDGIELDGDARITAEYPDFDTAINAPLFRIETWREGSSVDAIDIGFGACGIVCTQAPDYCIVEDAVVEQVGVAFDDTGRFRGSGLGPREWRGTGCMFCTFRGDSGSGALCSQAPR